MAVESLSLFEYENQIVLDLFNEDGLVVLCEGLGLERIFLHFLHLYCDVKELVFVLNTDYMQQQYYIEKLEQFGVTCLPKVLTSEINVHERKKLYAKGGVFFASSRILVMDFLVDRIPVHLVSGLLVNKAHKMATSCQECFIMRLFRQKNKKGFIKAFTDNPVALTSGFASLEKTMKHLFCKKVFLWPRFHSSILSTLDKHSPEVFEVGINMSEPMKKIQSSLLEIVSACLRELKSDNPKIDVDNFTLENSLGKAFDRMIRFQLDPFWNQLSSKTKQLISDLRALRVLLQTLSQYDCVTFLSLLESFNNTEKTFEKNPGWILLEASDSLFANARFRVYGKKKLKVSTNNLTFSDSEVTTSSSEKNELFLEESPKWIFLKEILDEILQINAATLSTDLAEGKVLICAGDMRGVYVLKDFLLTGSKSTMLKLYKKLFQNKFLESQKKYINNSVTGEVSAVEYKNNFKIKVLDKPETYLHALHDNPDPYNLTRILDKIKPRFVILYDNSIHFVRQLEVFKITYPGIPLRVYFLTYQSSAEEQIYLTALRKEKEAFQFLIKEKSSMVIPTEIEGKAENDPYLQRGTKLVHDTCGAGNCQVSSSGFSKTQVVVVDMREFRSELPALLYKQGINIEPVTIDVGDYILTPDVCVERKSLNDLIGSLNSGRLYSQCTAMCRHYIQPMLLIEFDANKAFSFLSRGITRAHTTLKDINEKISLLLLHFPKLRLAWCSSPSAAVQLFQEIKVSQEQPDPLKAASIVFGNILIGSCEQLYNSTSYDVLLKLPGIDTKNCSRISHSVKNIEELCQLSVIQLEILLDSKINADKLYTFLHKKINFTPANKSNEFHLKPKRPFSSIYAKSVKSSKSAKN